MYKPEPNPQPLLPPELAKRFEQTIDRLHAHEPLDLHEKDLSALFEVIATRLFAALSHRSGCYFDGVSGMTSNIPSRRTIDFKGEMWIGRNRDQWTEPFHARIVDKRTTHQGLSITLTIGQDKAQGDLTSVLPPNEDAE
ncbi:hypothetical protein [Pedosphaera parvula]|uniref:Uncharacterized protein n=1 Tax=Pedosphaera parvula (strain Ellin514) TaxID=320771 RepID=B9XT18_PEDPL|nr:hypothetical protein [Pedosphaera parvula]EEF57008.1 hypothetical protein Cflav_PD0037 [Pedosphaera parvula Ellin514]